MRCLICESTDQWENVDQYRETEKKDDKPVGMSVCKSCGFISYPDKYKSKEEILEYYRKDYRGGAPTFNNLTTGQRKLYYHQHFLKEVFMKWEANKTKPVIGEVGSAIGMVMNMFKRTVPDCEVHGTELTKTYRNVAFQEFGINLKEELPEINYDLIMTYKVAEHQLDVDKEFEKYHKMLNEDGYLYVSVPTWFGVLENFGLGNFDLDYYYHPDHINTWTEKLFRSLLKKTGFQIIKEDHFTYGDTYLCKKTKPQKLTQDDFEKYEDIIKHLDTVKKVSILFKQRKFDEAVKLWPNFPLLYSGLYEKNRQVWHQEFEGNGKAIANHVCKMIKDGCGECSEYYRVRADILMRYGHYKDAVEALDQLLEIKPNLSGPLLSMSHCFRELAKTETDPLMRTSHILTARDLCRKVVEVDQGARVEAYNWSLHDNASLDTQTYVDYIQKTRKNKKSEKTNEKPMEG